jgi:hypothetical protein
LLIDNNHETAAKFHTAQTWLRIFEWGMVSHTPAGAGALSCSLSGAAASGRKR